MKLLVLGGSGFIGRNVIEQLGAKYQILAPTHAELELLDEKAVRDYLKVNSVDIVIHSAVKPGHRNAKDSSNQLYDNCRIFFNLARNADCFGKMIYLSSGLVYDQRHYQPKMKEEYFDAHVPIDEGGFSKYIAAKYIETHKNIVELRIFGIFGKYEDYAIRLISNMICKALFDLPLTMKQNRKFDYIYIDDLPPVIEHFIENDSSQKAFNVTPDHAIELLTLAEQVKKISGKDLPIKVAQSEMGVEYSGDNTRLRSEMKKLSFLSIDKAVARLYQWYADNKSMIKQESLLVDK
ncbi:NAD(P)-dependent oxidoreductase [Candidatus Saganbacteria bacterium]|nr:NAD(P)-dependent oxidoreductase [Candidatus Saganbacteria bacterium]